MKLSLSKMLFISIFCFITLPLLADFIETGGTWNGKGKRTLLPAEPTACINNNVLSIHFTDAITNLYVCVTDSDGNIIYSDSISAIGNNYTYDNIVLPLVQGETYRLEMSHVLYGYLTGTFTY